MENEEEEGLGDGMFGICWYCHWGWPKQVRDIYDEACEALISIGSCESPLEFGPSHSVWSDESWWDSIIKSCIGDCVDVPPLYSDYSKEELAIVKESLEKLLAVPLEVRLCIPKDYDGEHPGNYPPPAGLEMMRK